MSQANAVSSSWGGYEEAASHLGRAVVAYATAFLLWIFFLAVFLPAAAVPLSEPVLPIIALVFTTGIAVEVYWGTVNLIDFLDLSRLGRVARFLLLEFTVLLDSLLLTPPLYAISPAVGGAYLIVALVIAVLILLTHSDVVVELAFKLVAKSEERKPTNPD